MRRRIITYSLLLLILVVAFPLLLITQEAESEGGDAGRTFEEEVKGEFKGKIEEVKPEIVLEYDIFEIIESYAGEK